jgi:structural maintenance of chromosome 1
LIIPFCQEGRINQIDQGTMGRISRLECFNFKSYAGHQVLGPFKEFTAVIGPNGAGKSNLMDAISFVLGVRAAHLRGNHLKDLIHRSLTLDESGAPLTPPRTGEVPPPEDGETFVTMVYVVDERDHLPGKRTGDELPFRRSVSYNAADGTTSSTYQIDGTTVTKGAYEDELMAIGIVVKARNSLVFQGDVESIAQKKPEDLTKFFEQISGSIRFKRDYDSLKTRKVAAEDNVIHCHKMRKNLQNESKQMEAQREEASQFEAKEKELAKLNQKYFLWQLFHVDKEIHEQAELVALSEKKIEGAIENEAAAAELYGKQKQEYHGLHLQETKVAGDLNASMNALAKLVPQEIEIHEKVKRTKEAIVADGAKVVQVEKSLGQQEDDIRQLNENVTVLQKQLKDLEIAASNRPQQKAMELLAQHTEEYEALDVEFRKATVDQRHELEGLKRVAMEEQSVLDQIKGEMASLNEQKQTLKLSVANRESDIGGFQEKEKKLRVGLESCEKRLEAFHVVKKEKEGKKLNFARKLEDTGKRLRDAKIHRREDAREKRIADIVESLKRLFPGVHGRVSDLCEPTQRKYRMAVTVAMGSHMDSVIVDSSSVAIECIKYMKEQRLGVAQFIPLDSVKVKAVPEQYRVLGGSYKLILDVLKFPSLVKVAIQYVVGDSIVCDTFNEARALRYSRQIRVRVITLKGQIIHRNANITGGIDANTSDKARRWDDKEFDKIVREREEYEKAYKQLERELANGRLKLEGSLIPQTEEEISLGIRDYKKRLNIALSDITDADAKIESHLKEIEKISKVLKELKPKFVLADARLEEKQELVEKCMASIQEVEKTIYAELSAKVGVENVRRLKEQMQKEAKEHDLQREMLSTQLMHMKQEIALKSKRDLASSLGASKESVVTANQNLLGLEKKEKSIAKSIAKARKTVAGLEVQHKKLKEQAFFADAAAKQAMKKQKEVSDIVKGYENEQAAQDIVREQLRAKRHRIFRNAQLEQVSVPQLSSKPTEATADEGTEMDSDNEQPEVESPPGGGFKKDEDDTAQVDFSSLKKADKKSLSDEEKRIRREEYKDSIEGLKAYMAKVQPNHRAMNQLQETNQRLSDSETALKQAKERSRAITEQFEAVKNQRTRAFLNMFRKVSSVIDGVYKDLTRSSKHQAGGTANLYTENDTEPYEGGIKYNAQPPSKRFRDMDQLSGGEKTVAALALLFAVYEFRPSPFFVMDEIDAALDNVNVNKVSSYIRNRVDAPGSHFQAIVISLKDAFYGKADGLVGIYREKDVSKTVTMDLTQFDDVPA